MNIEEEIKLADYLGKLHDEIAVAAMQAMTSIESYQSMADSKLANYAYNMADQMLEERTRRMSVTKRIIKNCLSNS